jgi:nicotinamidase-related amidase
MALRGDLNNFYNYYLNKAAQGTDVMKGSVPQGPGITNSILVIDMQNDFVLPHPVGHFSVTDGINTTKSMGDFIRTNASKCTKVVFSRDSHDPNHCSFGGRKGPFPPHCEINSSGAEMHESMLEFASLENGAVIFKGMSPDVDSFGAYAYPDDPYSTGRQIGPECCASSKGEGGVLGSCADATGGFYLKTADGTQNLTLAEAFAPAPFKAETYAEIKDQIGSKFEVKDLLRGDETQHNVFVVGLAGDYCVRDTAINLAKKGADGVKLNVFVIQPLTRYAIIPMAIGLDAAGAEAMAKKVQVTRPGKDLTEYAFKFDPARGKFIPYTAEEASKVTGADVLSSVFHFLTDPRAIVANYAETRVKILPSIPTLSVAGGRRRTLRRRRSTRRH